MIQYRCLISYISKTESEHISDTTELFPVQKKFPSLSPVDAMTQAEADLTEALQNPALSIPAQRLGEKTAALKQLAAIFNIDVSKEP